MNEVIELIPLSNKSLDAQLIALTGDGFGYSSFHNEGDKSKLEPAGILVHIKTGMRFKVPLPVMSLAEYEKHPYKSVWTTERDDMECWPEVREQYIGKRTILSNENGSTVLNIEDIDFVISN
ncbi:hypothetical protein [Shewanella sp. UCD-KL12]|uniref:hypothetical protein n=1 Tax=Shewanella sp. UCD-KL12 TaxID=1917163 RepID=UPI00097094D1|nr:hypothetical protein [Shewanella sp. UCD-KL12]